MGWMVCMKTHNYDDMYVNNKLMGWMVYMKTHNYDDMYVNNKSYIDYIPTC